MPVRDPVASAVRALILGDIQEAVSLTAPLGPADMQAYELLLHAVLSFAAARRFAPAYTDADVIRYVAKVRAGTNVRAEDLDLDPIAAEAVLRRALGQPDQPDQPDPDTETRIRAVLALLTTVLGELKINEPAFDSLLAEARALANHWLSDLAVTDAQAESEDTGNAAGGRLLAGGVEEPGMPPSFPEGTSGTCSKTYDLVRDRDSGA